MVTLHEGLHAVLCMEVTGWEIPGLHMLPWGSQHRKSTVSPNHVEESSVMSSPRNRVASYPTHNSDITSVICKSQSSNFDKHINTVMLCIHLLSCP